MGHRKGEGKKIEAHPDFRESWGSILHTKLCRVEHSLGARPSMMRQGSWLHLAPHSHRRLLTCSYSLPIVFLLQLLQHLQGILSAFWSVLVEQGLQLLGQDGQELLQRQQLQDLPLAEHLGPQPLPAKLVEPAQGLPGPRGLRVAKLPEALAEGLWAQRSFSSGSRGYIRGLPSLTQGSHGPLKSVEGVLMTLNFADIWTGNSLGPLIFKEVKFSLRTFQKYDSRDKWKQDKCFSEHHSYEKC